MLVRQATLRYHINHHRSNIRLNKLTPVAIHFNSHSHSLKHFTAIPIEVFGSDTVDKIHGLGREYYWQLRLGTIFPNGLNNFPVNDPAFSTSNTINNTTDFELLLNLRALETST